MLLAEVRRQVNPLSFCACTHFVQRIYNTPSNLCGGRGFKGNNLVDANKKSKTGKPHRYKAVRCFESRGRVHCCPWSISVSKITGNIALADYYNHRVQLMDSDWNFVGTDRGRESWWRENR